MIKLKDMILESIAEKYTYVAPSKIPGAGKGLFAARDIPKHEFIIVAPPTHIPDNEWELLKQHAPELLKRYGYSWSGGHYAVIGKNWPGFRLSSDAKKAISQTVLRHGFNEFNFINDDQENPNVGERFANNVKVFALRDIAKGEELLKKYPPDGTATYKPDIYQGMYKDYDYLKQ